MRHVRPWGDGESIAVSKTSLLNHLRLCMRELSLISEPSGGPAPPSFVFINSGMPPGTATVVPQGGAHGHARNLSVSPPAVPAVPFTPNAAFARNAVHQAQQQQQHEQQAQALAASIIPLATTCYA